MRKSKTTPTELQFTALNGAYNYFNQRLFHNKLPGCILNFSRLRGTHGFLAPDRWKRIGEKEFSTHEISLSPSTLYRQPIEIFSTLVHEMVHLWQWELGKPSRNGYHNREWATKMKELGLNPSNTGQPGGKETGQQMTHYIVKNGRYEKAFCKMSKKLLLPFTSLDAEVMKRTINGESKSGPPKPNDERNRKLRKLRPISRKKTKYTCPGCNVNVWGKPELVLRCGVCKRNPNLLPQ